VKGEGKAIGFRLKAGGKARERNGETGNQKRGEGTVPALSEQREALRLGPALARSREGPDGSGATHD
jgi:hypothetical protein